MAAAVEAAASECGEPVAEARGLLLPRVCGRANATAMPAGCKTSTCMAVALATAADMPRRLSSSVRRAPPVPASAPEPPWQQHSGKCVGRRRGDHTVQPFRRARAPRARARSSRTASSGSRSGLPRWPALCSSRCCYAPPCWAAPPPSRRWRSWTPHPAPPKTSTPSKDHLDAPALPTVRRCLRPGRRRRPAGCSSTQPKAERALTLALTLTAPPPPQERVPRTVARFAATTVGRDGVATVRQRVGNAPRRAHLRPGRARAGPGLRLGWTLSDSRSRRLPQREQLQLRPCAPGRLLHGLVLHGARQVLRLLRSGRLDRV